MRAFDFISLWIKSNGLFYIVNFFTATKRQPNSNQKSKKFSFMCIHTQPYAVNLMEIGSIYCMPYAHATTKYGMRHRQLACKALIPSSSLGAASNPEAQLYQGFPGFFMGEKWGPKSAPSLPKKQTNHKDAVKLDVALRRKTLILLDFQLMCLRFEYH